MTFGDGADKSTSKEIYSLSRDKGVNFFDCANVYAGGESERILGELIRDERDQVIISTKAYFPTTEDINGNGLSRFHLTKELEKSLKRLDTEYVDIYFLHAFDKNTPLEESLSTLNDFVRQGKVLYVGLSNFAAWQVVKAISVTERFGFSPISCIQPMYNLLKRQCESEILPMAKSEGLGVVSYSPLAGGLLTGKYIVGNNVKGRFKTNEMYQRRYKGESNAKTIKRFMEFCDDDSYDPASLAIGWVNSHPDITSPIIGARNTEQLKPALASVELIITSELRKKIAGFSPSPALATDRAEELRDEK